MPDMQVLRVGHSDQHHSIGDTMNESLLSRVRRFAQARYLNTGETLTLTLIAVMLDDALVVSRQDLIANHTLSSSTVSAHLRTLSQRGLISRNDDTITPLFI